jgi:hypothetical protein
MPTTTGKIYLGSTLVAGGAGGAAADEWVRNAAWPALTAPGAAEQKIVGLYAVWPGDGVGKGGNFFAFLAQGAYIINYGDGTTTNYASNARADYEFDFNSAALAGTNAPVTFTAATSTVNRTAHGLSNGAIVRFYSIVTTTGIVAKQRYFVVNAAANTFQVSLTAGGSPVTFTGDGSATLLPYKVAVVTITPQAGQNLTVANFFQKHGQTGLVNGYATGWLDIAMALPQVSGTGLTIGGSTTVVHANVERINIVSVGALTSMASTLFQGCRSLQSLPSLPNATAVTNMSSMFSGCPSLQTIPVFPGSVAAVTNMSSMFSGCSSLQAILAFPGSVAAVTNMATMFQSCSSLQTIPVFPGSVAAVTNMGGMFQGCFSLQTIPVFPGSVAAVTNMSSMFQNCSSLQTIPAFPGSVAAVTNMSSMFQSCSSLQTIPAFPGSVAAVTNMSSMFQGCTSLESIPPLDMSGISSAANAANFVANCSSLARAQLTGMRFSFSVASCKLSAAALNELFTGLPVVTGQTITVTGNYGINGAGYDPTIATAKGWTVTA